MQKVKKIVLLTALSFLFSCVSKKNIVYFQNDTTNQTQFTGSYKTTFKPDDILQITISSADIEAAKPFNLPVVSFAAVDNSVVGTPTQQGYLIDNDGYINFPILGKLKVAGLTRTETIDILTKKLSPDYLKNPTINIRISNFRITILGDVKKPGTYTIPNERLTILDALGLAGDLNISGMRIIEVKREQNGELKSYTIDLRSNQLFNSPVYYLQQNDVIYVKPNKARSQSASYNQNTGLFISIASVLITLISVLTR